MPASSAPPPNASEEQACAGDQVLGRDASAAGSSGDPPTVASAEQSMEKIRQEAKSTLRLAANLLCMRSHTSLMLGIVRIGEPCKQAHSRQVVECKTQQGAVEWLAAQCAGSFARVAVATAGKLDDAKLLKELNFSLPSRYHEIDCAALQEEVQMSERLYAFVIELIASEVCEGRVFSEFAPYAVGALLSHDEEVKRKNLAYFEEVTWCSPSPGAFPGNQGPFIMITCVLVGMEAMALPQDRGSEKSPARPAGILLVWAIRVVIAAW